MLVDTHAHLAMKEYDGDREAVVLRAREAGVSRIVSISTDAASARETVGLAEKFEGVFASVGVHPHDAGKIRPGDLEDLLALAAHPKVVAWGEIGLDYHYDHSPRDVQREMFRRQINLARTAGLPLVIHTREADADTLAVLEDERAGELGGVFHCFSGDWSLARTALDMGFHVSFSGIVTFKKAEVLRGVARMIPSDRLLVETDAPFLAPVPFRGKRNEPARLSLVAACLAEVRSLPVEEIVRVTTENAARLFSPPSTAGDALKIGN
ncbi:MAG: hydrolase TatD [Nitrospirae bacterium RBG_16_64_22]|nr:MAG: hydrolase TatD [Nitrospirae bacterium RBG_16_64_22]